MNVSASAAPYIALQRTHKHLSALLHIRGGLHGEGGTRALKGAEYGGTIFFPAEKRKCQQTDNMPVVTYTRRHISQDGIRLVYQRTVSYRLAAPEFFITNQTIINYQFILETLIMHQRDCGNLNMPARSQNTSTRTWNPVYGHTFHFSKIHLIPPPIPVLGLTYGGFP